MQRLAKPVLLPLTRAVMVSQILGRQATASNAVIPEEDAGESPYESVYSVRWTLQYVCVRTDIYIFFVFSL